MNDRYTRQGGQIIPDREVYPRGPWTPPARPVMRKRGLVLPLIGMGALYLLVLGMCSRQEETPATRLARCETAASYSGLKAIDPDHLPPWYSRAQFDALPQGYSTLPDGEGVTVNDGCAFVFVTGVRERDGSIGPAPAGATTAPE